MTKTAAVDFDIIMIGAGLSGIDAACHFKMKCPSKSFAIFEGRDTIGGTWDLFKYPGIRSDSDMHTFSYSFKPWTYHKSISDAGTIMRYLEETVEEFGLRKHIRFNSQIKGVSWSSETKTWTLSGFDAANNAPIQASCKFLMLCTGYYDYEEGYTPDFKGLDKYQGEFVHPQHWNPDIVYKDKDVVVIGSGATAVTLIPAMAEATRHITMLQRSPSYILSQPLHDGFAKMAHKVLPARAAHSLARWKNILLNLYFYRMSKKNPKGVKKYIQGKIRKVLGKDFDIQTHFEPKYNPWDERLCAVPDNDLFKAINSGKCSIVTDHIDTFTPSGILLKSGKELKADLVISATGLKLKLAGGIEVKVDGELLSLNQKLNYKGAMLQDIPNASAIIGYTNASWTLKADLICNFVCRLINYMDKKGYEVCTPRLQDGKIETLPIIDFSSGYIQRSIDQLPKQGDRYPWKLHQNYIKDLKVLKYDRIDEGHLEFG